MGVHLTVVGICMAKVSVDKKQKSSILTLENSAIRKYGTEYETNNCVIC